MVLIVFFVAHLWLFAQTIDSKTKGEDSFLERLNAPIYDFILQKHHEMADKFKSGDTNTPLLLLEWFINDRYVQSCRVSKSGWACWSDYGQLDGSGRGGVKLDADQQEQLVESMNILPPAPTLPLKNRWLLVSGIRSNAWFTQIYDRADIPVEVEKLFSITHGRLEWIVGDAESSTNVAGRYGDTWVNFLQTASKAPIAVSSSAVASGRSSDSIQLWDTKEWKEIMIPAVQGFTTFAWCTAVLSSNGQFIAMGVLGGARGVDLTTGSVRWDFKHDIHDNHWAIKQLAFAQGDKQLAVALPNAVEIWDALTGKRLDVLVTNEAEIDLMKASRDGKLLAIVSGKKKIQIWDLEKRTLVRESMDAARYVYAIEFSPDGQCLAFSGAPYRDGFVLWDLKTGNTTQIPARGSQYFDEMVSLTWSSDGKFFAATPQGRDSLIFNAHTWKPIARWHGVGGAAGCIAFTADGKLLSRLNDGSLRVLDVPNLRSVVEQSRL